MFTEKEYPLKAGTLSTMLSLVIRVYVASEKADQLVQRIQEQCSRAIQALKSKTLCLEASS